MQFWQKNMIKFPICISKQVPRWSKAIIPSKRLATVQQIIKITQKFTTKQILLFVQDFRFSHIKIIVVSSNKTIVNENLLRTHIRPKWWIRFGTQNECEPAKSIFAEWTKVNNRGKKSTIHNLKNSHSAEYTHTSST